MRRIAMALLLALVVAGCGGGPKAAAPATTTTAVPTTEPATEPAVTSDPSVGSLCSTAVGAMLDGMRSDTRGLHISDVVRLPDTDPLTQSIHETLIDCSSRIEWLTAVVDEGSADQSTFDGLFQSECKLERFLNQSMGNLPNAGDAISGGPHVFDPTAHPIPLACQ